MCSGSDPSLIKPSFPLPSLIIADLGDTSPIIDGTVEDVFKRLDDLNLFSATWRSLVRVSLEFHCPSLLGRFLIAKVVVIGLEDRKVLFVGVSRKE